MYQNYLKRLLDICAAALLLALFFPLLLIIMTAVVLDLGRPVLFRQQRAGQNGRLFYITKFRTMRNSESTTDVANRVTALGAFLRKSSLDELPELWNVLKGEMSLVGPRPLLA